jgi:hypothetical protein
MPAVGIICGGAAGLILLCVSCCYCNKSCCFHHSSTKMNTAVVVANPLGGSAGYEPSYERKSRVERAAGSSYGAGGGSEMVASKRGTSAPATEFCTGCGVAMPNVGARFCPACGTAQAPANT